MVLWIMIMAMAIRTATNDQAEYPVVDAMLDMNPPSLLYCLPFPPFWHWPFPQYHYIFRFSSLMWNGIRARIVAGMITVQEIFFIAHSSFHVFSASCFESKSVH